MTDSQEVDHFGVHVTHCCVWHGCKYRDDDCPVETKQVKQAYDCEACGWEDEEITELYSVTMLEPLRTGRLAERMGPNKFPETRCVAVCTTERIAVKMVEENWADIHEHTHQYAVIEPFIANSPYSLGPDDKSDRQRWYKWEGTAEEGKFVPCTRPSEHDNVISWGVG
jgi:hypothetical protein